MKRTVWTLFAVLLVASLDITAFAVDQEITDKYVSAGTSPEAEELAVKQREPGILDKFKVDGYIDVQQGYDNNVDLNSKRHKDGFLQTSANGEVVFKQNNRSRWRAGADFFSTVYYKYNVNNIFDINPYLGYDYAITPDIIWRNRVGYEYFAYPNQKESSFSGLNLRTTLRHYFLENAYHELTGEYIKRWFPDRKVALHDLRMSRTDRADDRWRLRYNVGVYGEKFFARVSNQVSNNESNDQYQEYYDYWLYRLRPSVMIFITDKLYTDLSLLYRYTKYKDRRNTEDSSEKVYENTYVGTAALYYDITKNVTLELTYSYTDNTSNDPFQRYSGTIITGGLYYSF